MRRAVFTLALLFSPGVAGACATSAWYRPEDAKAADVVAIGRIGDYHEATDARGQRYARFVLSADTVLKGKVRRRFVVTHELSYKLSLLDDMLAGNPVLMVLRRRPAKWVHEPGTLALVEGPCSDAFVYGADTNDARWVRRALDPQYPGPAIDVRETDFAVWPDAAKAYPQKALDDELEGSAALDCVVVRRERLTCTVTGETPQSYGFGAAGVKLFDEQARLRPGVARVGQHVRVSFRWPLD